MRILYSLLFTLCIVWTSCGQKIDSFDAYIDNSILRSEQALFDANFKDALRYIDIEHFSSFKSFTFQHRIQLTVQQLRVEGFRNLLFQMNSDREKNLSMLTSLFEDALKLERQDALGNYFLSLSSAYRSVGAIDSGQNYESKALSLFSKTGDLKRVAEIRANQISRRHNRLLTEGKKDEILAMMPEYEEEITYATAHSKYALAYNTRHLGQIYRRQTDDLDKALVLFKESLNFRREIGFKPFIPASVSSLGDVHLAMKDYDQAIDAYKESIKLAEEIGFIRYQIYPNMQLGDIYAALDDTVNANLFYQQALIKASKHKNAKNIEEALKRLGTSNH